MIIYLYGADSYRRLKKQGGIVDIYKQKYSSLTVDRFYLDEGEAEWRRCQDFINMSSLFDKSRLAVISGLSELASTETADFFSELANKKEVTILLSEDKGLSKGFEFLFKKPVVSQEFGELSGEQLKSFILAEAGVRGFRPSTGQLRLLADTYKGDSWGLVTELDKLAVSGNTAISDSRAFPAGSIFKLIYSLRSSNFKIRLFALEVLLMNEDAAKVFNLFAYSSQQKRRFADYDLAVKSGKLDYETALVDLVLSAS